MADTGTGSAKRKRKEITEEQKAKRDIKTTWKLLVVALIKEETERGRRDGNKTVLVMLGNRVETGLAAKEQSVMKE